MSDWFYSDQLMRHLKSFKDEKTKALITIAPELMAEKKKSDFEKELKKYNALQEFPVIHVNTTFEILAEAIRSVLDERDYEMQDVLDDYLNYCYNDSLIVISDSWKWMRVQLAGTTFKFNMAKDLYYDNIDRGFRAHDYLGLYTGKSVRAIGKIRDIVTTGREGTGALTYTVEKGKLTNEMKEKIECAIADGKNYGYELKATRYFFVESFFETDYKKDTSNAPRGSRIFDLTQILGMDTLPPVSEIAEELKVKTWSYGQLYHVPVTWLLHDAGLYVSVINAMLVHDYGNNSLRRAKTDRKDAVKIANYGLDHWLMLPQYFPEKDTRLMLKSRYRQYQQYAKVQTMLKNNLISLLVTAFPDSNRLFSSPARTDGSEKWVDFVAAFWHCECVCGVSLKSFAVKYQKWCRKHGYNFSADKALDIYASACEHGDVMPKTDTAKLLVEQAVSQLRSTSVAMAALKQEMQMLSSSLPEYSVVMGMYGVGLVLGPQLMAEIGDTGFIRDMKIRILYFEGGIRIKNQMTNFFRGRTKLRPLFFYIMQKHENYYLFIGI